MKFLYGLPVLLLAGAPVPALAQDMATVGDWRHLGESNTTTYAWDRGSERPSGDDLIVRMMSAPLRPETGPRAVQFELQEVRVNCARRGYVIAYQQTFGADGRALAPVDPPRAVTRPPLVMQDVAGTPVAVFFPYLCEGVAAPAANRPSEALPMSREQRSYVLSGTADHDRQAQGRASAPR